MTFRLHWCIVLLGAWLAVLACCSRTPVSSQRSSGKAGTADWEHHTQGLPFVIGYEAGMAQAKAQGKPAMLFVTTTWCGWCKKLAAESFHDNEIREMLSKHFVCVIVDGDTEQSTTAKFGVRGYPHVIFVQPDGKKLGECRGYVAKDTFKKIVEEALAKA